MTARLRVVPSDIDQIAGHPTAADSEPPDIIVARDCVLDACRAETAAERHTNNTYRRAAQARRGTPEVREHDAALEQLARARQIRRDAVTELERLENTLADES